MAMAHGPGRSRSTEPGPAARRGRQRSGRGRPPGAARARTARAPDRSRDPDRPPEQPGGPSSYVEHRESWRSLGRPADGVAPLEAAGYLRRVLTLDIIITGLALVSCFALVVSWLVLPHGSARGAEPDVNAH